MTEPIYSSELATIYLGDCLDILPRLDPADLVVTDPPYGIAYKSEWSASHARIAGDGCATLATLALGAVPIRAKRHVYSFWSPKVPWPDIPGLQEWTELVWDKVALNTGGRHCWAGSHEQILFSVAVSGKAKRDGRGRGAARLRRSSVLRVSRLSGLATRRHPTEKPVALLRDLIEASSRAGELVLDPFAGVGSTLVAAILEGRRAVGIEIDPGYAAIAVERVKVAERIAREAARA